VLTLRSVRVLTIGTPRPPCSARSVSRVRPQYAISEDEDEELLDIVDKLSSVPGGRWRRLAGAHHMGRSLWLYKKLAQPLCGFCFANIHERIHPLFDFTVIPNGPLPPPLPGRATAHFMTEQKRNITD
jgi:hypothetical protein